MKIENRLVPPPLMNLKFHDKSKGGLWFGRALLIELCSMFDDA